MNGTSAPTVEVAPRFRPARRNFKVVFTTGRGTPIARSNLADLRDRPDHAACGLCRLIAADFGHLLAILRSSAVYPVDA